MLAELDIPIGLPPPPTVRVLRPGGERTQVPLLRRPGEERCSGPAAAGAAGVARGEPDRAVSIRPRAVAESPAPHPRQEGFVFRTSPNAAVIGAALLATIALAAQAAPAPKAAHASHAQ